MVDAHSNSSGAGASDAPPVTLCCSAVDETTVRRASEALLARGHMVQVAVGVDVDEQQLTQAITAQEGRGLFVLCRSGSLDRAGVDRLREILRSHDVPFGRTLTLAVDSQNARELEERVVSVLRRMVTGRADVRARSWGTSNPSVTGPEYPDTTVRTPKPPLPAPEAAPPSGGEGIVPPAYNGAEHTAIATPAVGSAPLPVQSSVGSAPLPVPSSVGSAPLSVPSSMGSAPLSVPPTGSAPLSAGAALPVTSPDGPPSEDGLSGEGSSAPVVAPSQPGIPQPVGAFPSVHADESAADFEPPLTLGGRMGQLLGSPAGLAAVLGGLAVIVLVVVLVGVLGDDDDAKTDEVAAKTSEAASTKEPETKPDEAKPEGTPSEASEAGAESEALDVDDAGGAEAEAAAAAAAEPSDAAAPTAATEDPPEVVEALKNREVRAIDIFLVAPERKGTLSYEPAVSYCEGLEVAGLGQWRVPTIGELNSVAGARMLGKAIYWSSTFGDAFGDSMIVRNTKKDRISVVAKGWDGGKITCIRPRRP